MSRDRSRSSCTSPLVSDSELANCLHHASAFDRNTVLVIRGTLEEPGCIDVRVGLQSRFRCERGANSYTVRTRLADGEWERAFVLRNPIAQRAACMLIHTAEPADLLF